MAVRQSDGKFHFSDWLGCLSVCVLRASVGDAFRHNMLTTAREWSTCHTQVELLRH